MHWYTNDKVFLAITAVATSIAAVATSIAAAAAWRAASLSRSGLDLQRDLIQPSTSSIQIEGTVRKDACPSVSPDHETFSGRADMQRNERLWILLSAPRQGKTYVSSVNWVAVGKTDWRTTINQIGDKQGGEFEVLGVAADANASNYLRNVVLTKKTPVIDALPQGTSVIASQCVKTG